MKSKTDFITGIIGIIFCMVGAWNYTTIDDVSAGTDHLGPGTYPIFILVLTLICSCILMFKSFRYEKVPQFWPQAFIMKKVFAVILSFIFYIVLLVVLDAYFEDLNQAWLDNNMAFAVSTYIYLVLAMYITGRRKIIEFLYIPILIPSIVIVCFVYGFNILLP